MKINRTKYIINKGNQYFLLELEKLNYSLKLKNINLHMYTGKMSFTNLHFRNKSLKYNEEMHKAMVDMLNSNTV